MLHRAEVLKLNTTRLRFFKGQVYDGGADEYLRQLHGFLDDYIAEVKARDGECADAAKEEK